MKNNYETHTRKQNVSYPIPQRLTNLVRGNERRKSVGWQTNWTKGKKKEGGLDEMGLWKNQEGREGRRRDKKEGWWIQRWKGWKVGSQGWQNGMRGKIERWEIKGAGGKVNTKKEWQENYEKERNGGKRGGEMMMMSEIRKPRENWVKGR